MALAYAKLSKTFSYCNRKYVEIILKKKSLSREPKILLNITGSHYFSVGNSFAQFKGSMENICIPPFNHSVIIYIAEGIYLLATGDRVISKKEMACFHGACRLGEKGLTQTIGARSVLGPGRGRECWSCLGEYKQLSPCFSWNVKHH